jgi:hypothetical protein
LGLCSILPASRAIRYKLGPVQGGRRGGAAATGGGKAEVAGAVEAADYRRGGSCGNGGRQGGRMAVVAAVWPARWSGGNVAEVAGAVVVADYLRSGSCGNAGWQGGTMAAVESIELVCFGRHRAGSFWLAQSWSVLAGEELVRFGTELEYDRLRGDE